jgi:Kef-type K+ transport system membrane component KefB
MIDEAVRSGIAFNLAVLGLVVIFAPLIAERLRLPGLVGLLIGGALIGPNVLGVLDDFTSLERIGELGILYLIFLAGLQLDRETFARYRDISIGFGLITSVVSLVLGTVVALRLGFEARAAILIGSFWASFTLIAYPVLQQYDLSRNRAGAAVIGASAVTDTVSLLILAVIVGLETGDSSGAGLILGIALGLAALAGWCLIVLPWVTFWFFSTLGRGRVLRFLLVLVGLTSSAVVAEVVGIEPLLGAFFAGLGLNRMIPNESPLMDNVDFVGNALFIPAFLVSVGLLFAPAVMFVGSTLWLALWLSVALVAGKAIAAWMTGRAFRLAGPESGLLFAVSVAQAAATLAGTIIGLEIGLYGEDVVNAVMVVIAVSLIITSVGTPWYAQRIERPEAEERRLGEKVVFAVKDAGGGLASRLRLTGRIAEAGGGVVVPVLVSVPETADTLSASRGRVAEIDDELHALGLEGETRIRVDRSLAEGLVNATLESDASLVVLGWAGLQPVTGILAETIASEVARNVECPVVVVAAVPAEPERAVLIVRERDLHGWSLDAVRTAARLAVSLAPQRRLTVGPLARDEIAAAGIELPEWAEYEPGGSDVVAWAEQVSERGDVIVAASRGRPSERGAQAIVDGGRSVIGVTSSKAPRWVTGDPAVRFVSRPR